MPLCTCGWTLQEVLLLPHILYLTGDDIFWAVEQGLRCHCPTQYVFKIGDIKSKFLVSMAKLGEANHQTWSKEWRDLVENNSTRLLTKQSEIFLLPVLSGLARRHQNLHISQYLAGSWAAELLIDLFWSRTLSSPNVFWGTATPGSLARATRPYPDSAPTWSWVSIQGAVDWKNKQLPSKFEQPATVIDAAYEIGENPWG